MQEKFYQYNLKSELAKKYSHSTYLASPTNPQRGHGEPECQVVLTVFASSLFHFPHEREKFLKKAKRIKKLQHPRLVSILDMGIEQDQPFIVREYLPNGSLRSRLKKLSPHHLELGEALSIVSQVGKALAYAHEHDIFHGNIKPENILLDASGRAALTDFNLVSRNDAIIRDQIAEEYAFCYLAPEQFSGICNARSDQYALGCLAYELITGRMPFAAQSLASMMGQHHNTDPAPLSDGVVDLSPSLEVAVLKALAKDPDERFDDFLLFLEVIQSVLSLSPAFPLTRSTGSRDTRTASHSTQSAKVEIAVSPIRKRATKRSVPQLFEPSRAFFNFEVDVAEPVAVTPPITATSIPAWAGSIPHSESLISVLPFYQLISPLSGDTDLVGNGENDSLNQPLKEQKLNESSATMPEAIPQSEGPISGLVVAASITEQETDDSWLANLFVGQDEDESSVITSLENSVYGQKKYAADQMIPPLIGSTGEIVSLTVPTRSSKRRSVGRFLLLSLLVGLIAYASVLMALGTASTLWPSGTVKPDTHSHVTQVATTQTVNNFTVASSPVQHTNGSTTQPSPSVQPTDSPTVQPSPSVQPTDSLTVQPSPSVQPTDTPASGGFNSGWGGFGGGFGGGGGGGGGRR